MFDALQSGQNPEREWLQWLTSSLTVPVNAGTLSALAGIGGTSLWAQNDRTTMEAAMTALMQFQGSRAQELWGENKTVTASDVGRAANES